MNTLIKNQVEQTRKSVFAGNNCFHDAFKCVLDFSQYLDELVLTIFVTRLGDAFLSNGICLVALGGYGRKELCPYSDLDLMILFEKAEIKEHLIPFIADLWDTGLSIGVVVRTLKECRRVIGEDPATDSALLECRYIGGDSFLYGALRKKVIDSWLHREKTDYVKKLHLLLRERMFSSQSSVYKIEPDLKNGICDLRDCQRVVWALAVNYGRPPEEKQDLFFEYPQAEVRLFWDGYYFLLGLRNVLHMIYGRRMDILESSRQEEVALRIYGSHDNPGLLISNYFKAVKNIRNFILLFLERTLFKFSVWTRIRHVLSAVNLKYRLYLVDGILFFNKNEDISTPHAPQWYVDLFYTAARYQGTLSVALKNNIRLQLKNIKPGEFICKEVMKAFLGIFGLDTGIGEIISEMHETGLLEKIIPEFRKLVLLVEFDTYHEYPVDEHTILMLKTLDRLESENEIIKSIYHLLPDKVLLRLSFLLHDIGKGLAGDHSINGVEIAENICDRLGLCDADKGLVGFLIAKHLLLSSFSFSPELDSRAMTDFVREIQDTNRLNYLFLLTYYDIKCVSAKAMTGWKFKILTELYRITKNTLDKKRIMSADNNFEPLRKRLTKKNDIIFEHRIYEGFEKLTVVSFDRKGFLVDLIACITSEGYFILSTKVNTFNDSTLVDVFHIQPDETTTTKPEVRLENLRRKWSLLAAHEITASQLVEKRFNLHPPKKIRPVNPDQEIKITIDNVSSEQYTIIQTIALDQFGLLYKIASGFLKLDINVVSAVLTSKIDLAVNTFYVLSGTNSKLENGWEEVERILRAKILQINRTDY